MENMVNTQPSTLNGGPIAFEQEIGAVISHLGQTHELMHQAGLSKELSDLIELRVSQINQCGYCVKLHSGESRAHGETDKRLDHLAIWRSAADFTDAEKAAFA